MSLASIMIVILFILLLFFLTLIVIGLRKQSTPPPITPRAATLATPKVSIFKKIPWKAMQAIIAIIIGIAIVVAFVYFAEEMAKSEHYETEIDGNVTKVTLSSEVKAYNCYEINASGNGSMTVFFRPTRNDWPEREEPLTLTNNATLRVACYKNNVPGEARAQMIIISTAKKFKLWEIIKK